jgi:hypothetical protein
MLGYRYTTEQELVQEQQRLNTIFGQLGIYTSGFEHVDECWYIYWNELIAPYMPEPIEIVFNYGPSL